MPSNSGPVDLTDEGIESIQGFVADTVSGMLSDTVWQVTDLPGFVASDEEVGVPAQLMRAVTRGACRSYARGGGPQNLPGFDAAWGGICEPYLDSIGEGTDDGSLGLPFRGGQCPGAGYYVTYQYYSVNTDGSESADPIIQPGAGGITGFVGPISGIETRPTASGVGIFISTGEGDILLRESSAPQGDFRRPTILSVQRAGGLPDDCGDPRPKYNPPRIPPGLPSVPSTPVRLPGVGPINIDVGFDGEGNIIVNLPDVGIEVPIDVPIDIGFGGDDGEPGGGGEDPPPGDVGSPGGGGTAGEGGDAEGEAPPGSEIVGLKLTLTVIPEGARSYAAGVYRGPAYIYMGTPVGLDQDYAGSMLAQTQFVFAERKGLTNWRVKANDGYEIFVVPYYREVE